MLNHDAAASTAHPPPFSTPQMRLLVCLSRSLCCVAWQPSAFTSGFLPVVSGGDAWRSSKFWRKRACFSSCQLTCGRQTTRHL